MPINPQTYRATLFFEQGDDGWTETLFRTGADSLQAMLTAVQGLYQARCMLMGSDTMLAYVRVSQENVWRDSLVDAPLMAPNPVEFPTLNVKQCAIAVSDDSAPPFTAVEVRRELGPLYRSTWFCRGVPKVLGVTHATPAALASQKVWADALDAYAKLLIAGQWGLVVRGRGLGFDEVPIVNVSSVAVNPDTLPLTLVLNNPQTWKSGDRVVIRKAILQPGPGATANSTRTINATWYLNLPAGPSRR